MVQLKTSIHSRVASARSLLQRRRADPGTKCPRPSLSRSCFVAILVLLAFVTLLGAAEIAHPIAAPDNCQLHPALEISLYAQEPDVVDPVALTFDEEGRVYVVEMRDYPYGFGPGRKPGGTVRLLEDTDGDGRIDRSVVFADGLSFPTSIVPWKGGVLVTAPPEVIFLQDTDGDGKADRREVVLQGFHLGVTDSNVNGLRWGLDNRVHGANGGNSGNLVSPRNPGSPLALRSLDFSFDPASGGVTTTSQTGGGFGLVFDEWGHSFTTYNINHLQQRILPDRYLRRFPGFPPVETTVSISDHAEMARIYPIAEAETRPNHPEQAGYFSAAGGLGYIGSPLFPGDLPGSVLVGDVVGNLVHRDRLVEDGPVFVARRSPVEQTSEFFASRDRACRPVGVEVGPDGALYLIDMQRDVIEHPDYIPQKLKEKLDLRAGADRGRLYRLAPKGGVRPARPKLRSASTAELVRHLSDPSQWWRQTAQRLLVERQIREAVPALRQLAGGALPLGRLHALWTLEGLGALDEGLVLSALAAAERGLRENALLLAETLLPGSPRLQERVLALAEDPAPRVRFQAALTIGQFRHARTESALRAILARDVEYRWTRLAVLSSLAGGEAKVLGSFVRDADFRRSITPAKLALLQELADLVGARASGSPQNVPALLDALSERGLEEPWQVAVLTGLQSGLDRVGGNLATSAATTGALEAFSNAASPRLLAAAWSLARTLGLPETDSRRGALARAAANTLDRSRAEISRLEYIRLLALGGYGSVGPALFRLLEGRESSAIQTAALDALKDFTEPDLAKQLIARWPGLAPAARPAVVHLLLQRRPFHPFLVEAMERGDLKVGELNLDLEQRRRLLRGSTPEIQARAAKLISDEEYSNRKTVVDQWLARLPSSGDPALGRATFEKLCAQCHQVGDLGSPVGPNLTAVAHRSVEDLLSNILDPNMAINPAYVAYSVTFGSGESETGILQSETPDAITLRQPLGKTLVVPRTQIQQLAATGLSLMPEGLEAGLTPAELRHLIAFLQEQR